MTRCSSWKPSKSWSSQESAVSKTKEARLLQKGCADYLKDLRLGVTSRSFDLVKFATERRNVDVRTAMFDTRFLYT